MYPILGRVVMNPYPHRSRGVDSPLTWRTVYYGVQHGRFEISVWLTHALIWVNNGKAIATITAVSRP
jgi:hypothetical protein